MDSLAENDILTPAAPTKQTPQRLKRLTDDFDQHFESHVRKGQILHLDKNCSFCEAYGDGSQK